MGERLAILCPLCERYSWAPRFGERCGRGKAVWSFKLHKFLGRSRIEVVTSKISPEMLGELKALIRGKLNKIMVMLDVGEIDWDVKVAGVLWGGSVAVERDIISGGVEWQSV